jgi:hypothetical protein
MLPMFSATSTRSLHPKRQEVTRTFGSTLVPVLVLSKHRIGFALSFYVRLMFSYLFHMFLYLPHVSAPRYYSGSSGFDLIS